jgi:hypothetical protein
MAGPLNRQTPIIVRTLADLLREGYVVAATCGACRRRVVLDVLALAVAHGEDRRPAEIAPRLRCECCGHRGAELSVIPTPGIHGFATRH